MIARLPAIAVLLAIAATSAGAQEALTLSDAMARARTATPDARALDAAEQEAEARVRQARAGYLPTVDVSVGAQRGDQPVFVFGSLLSQRRFTPADFAVDRLNHPSAVTNVRTAVTAAQPVWDAGLARLRVEQADINRALAAAARSRSTQDLAVAAAAAFAQVLQFDALQRASAAGVEAAESDLARARARRDVGIVTDADVLAVEVHLADMRERAIATGGDLEVARLTLHQAIGAPADAQLRLIPPVAAAAPADADALVRGALALRPEQAEAGLRERLVDNARRASRAAFLPQVGLQGGWEWNGDSLTDQQSSWVVGAEVRINVFRGFADQARIAEAGHAVTRAAAEREAVERRIDLEVRTALARLDAARARGAAGEAALAQARESQRIVRDRYDTGLASITDVLRAAEAALDAEARAVAAAMDVILERVMLDRAAGRLETR
ncbi:MAG: TolC family protein [Vicinamibacterales bacterium]